MSQYSKRTVTSGENERRSRSKERIAIWTLYALSDWSHDDEAALAIVRGDLKAVGSEMGTLHRHDTWEFFPHVSPEDFRAGFYQKLEALQGIQNTYITGEMIGSASVESVASYSTDLVQRFFG